MRILLVSNTLPPEGSAVAGIVDRLTPNFLKKGCEVDCLTLKKKLFAAKKISHNGITIYRAAYFLLLQKVIRKVKKMGRKLFNKKEKQFIYTEGDVKAYLREFKKLDLSQYDAIIPICAYYATIEALMRYKKKNRDFNVPVYLYQVDPLAYNKTFDASSFKEKLRYERAIYNFCTEVFTTSIIYKEKKELLWDVSKVKVLEFPLSGTVADEKKADPSEIICVFSGYLYGTIRDATYTLKIFSEFENKKIKLYILGTGQEKLLAKYTSGGLKDRLIRFGELPEEQCNKILSQADILVNIGNKVKNQIPSKIFHYIGTKKPILNMACFEDCPTIKYLDKYPLSNTVVEKENVSAEAAKEVEKWIIENSGRMVSQETINKNFKEHNPEFIVDLILKTIKEKKEVRQQ